GRRLAFRGQGVPHGRHDDRLAATARPAHAGSACADRARPVSGPPAIPAAAQGGHAPHRRQGGEARGGTIRSAGGPRRPVAVPAARDADDPAPPGEGASYPSPPRSIHSASQSTSSVRQPTDGGGRSATGAEQDP